jgi:hypothetical protein
MWLARKAPPRIAIDVASRCPAMAPPATPHGDCRKERGEELWFMYKYGIVMLLFGNWENHTCAAPRAIVASIERSPHS